MPTTTKFCTVDDVKAQINSADGWTGDDAAIETHIKQATALVRQYTRRTWELGTYTQYFSTKDINILIGRNNGIARFTLKEKPLQSITSVKYHTGGDFANEAALDSALYHLDIERNSVVMYPQKMTSWGRSLQVIYVAGFPVNGSDPELLDVDYNIRMATAAQAAFTWRRVLNQTTGTKQKQDSIGLTNYAISSAGLVAEAQALLRGETRLLMGGHA